MQEKTARARGTTAPQPSLEPCVNQWAVLLTTYKRDGTPIGTPVSIAVDGDRAFVRTFDTAWKLKRIRNNPMVEVAPSTWRGKPTGSAIRARARVLEGEEGGYAGRLLGRKHPVLHRFLVPLTHRLRGNETMHIMLTPVGG
jgi:PPOX class probable F420-dependent enzyme